MNGQTLVLNANFQPLRLVTWQQAFFLLCQDAAQAVDETYQRYDFDEWSELSKLLEEHPNGFVRTPHLRLAIPDVIRLVDYEGIPMPRVKFTRRNIYAHYRNICCYCAEKFSTRELNLDHVLPRSRGGHASWKNMVVSCRPCNSKKADRTPSEAGMKMHYKPSRPKERSAMEYFIRMPFKLTQTQQQFVDSKYWNTELKD